MISIRSDSCFELIDGSNFFAKSRKFLGPFIKLEYIIQVLCSPSRKLYNFSLESLPKIGAYFDKTLPNSLSLFKLFLISEMSFPSNAYFRTSFEKESLSA